MFAPKKLFARSRSAQPRRNSRRMRRLESLENRLLFAADLPTAPSAMVGHAAAVGQQSVAAPLAGAEGNSAVPANLSTVASELTHSQEYHSDFVTWAYQQFMDRTPDSAGLAYWIGQMQDGLTDEQLESTFLAAPEYIAHHAATT